MLGANDLIRIAQLLAATGVVAACRQSAGEPRPGVGSASLSDGAWQITDTGDFNGDGMADLLWNKASKSTMAVWLMAGAHVLAAGAPIAGPPGAGWSASWTADFNADGMADVRWYDTVNHETTIWLMSATQLLLAGPILPGPTGAGWERASSTDFNRDGRADLLWRNTLSHDAAVWLMNGTKPLLRGLPISPPPGDGWFAATSGDFNADGMADVVWSNPLAHVFSIGLMSGAARFHQGPTVPAPPGDGWAVLTTGDFNFDGMADLVWFDASTERTAIWLMSGTEPLFAGPELQGPLGGGWRVVTAGDFDGDQRADLIWESSVTHEFSIWLMSGTELRSATPPMPAPSGI